MAESYSLEAILSARDTNFTSTMDNAQKAMGGLSKAAGGIGASIGKIATGFGVFKAVSGTVKMLSSSISSLAGELNESSMAWQTFEANMTMLGKSSGEIDSVRKSLQDFATQTIYSASDMAQTYGQMAAIGVDDTEKLVKAMGGLAASAENPQQAMKTMSQQMVQAMTKPTLSWADFKLMLEQTPAGMAEVAKEMGYALDDFVVAVQDGEIASKDFAKAVSEVGTNEHFGSMATEFKSVGQAMDGARETIANKLMPAFEMLSSIGIKAISGLTDWIDTLDFTKLLAPIEALASMFGVATDEITTMTDTIKMSSDEIQSVADNWESMTLAEKQATVQTMGQEDLAELLEMLGVDFESIPDEYTKEAYLNAYGKDALEEIIWVSGEWENLTFDEKVALLEAQIDNDEIETAINDMELWNNTEFMSKFANISWNDDDAGQQVVDLINHYRELEGQEPIELEVDVQTKPAEKVINKFSGTYKKFGKSIRKITKGIGDVAKNIGEYFEPAFDFLGDLSKANLKMLGGYVDATGQLFEGDWSGAWETFKSATVEGLTDVVSSLKTNVPKMWDSMKVTAGNVWNWFDNISWSNVYDAINGFFSDIGDVVATIDWIAVAGEVGGAIGDFVSKTKGWLDENLPKAINWVQEVLLNPESKLNKDASEFKSNIDKMFAEFIEGLGIKEAIIDWIVKINAKPFFDWGSWQNEIDAIMSIFKNEDYDQAVFLDISIQRSQGRSEEEIEQIIDDMYGEGTYEKHIQVRIETEAQYDASQAQEEIDIEASANVKITEVEIDEMDARTLINAGGQLGMVEQDIDGNFTINPNYRINEENPNIDEAALGAKLLELLGEPEIGMGVSVAPEPKIVAGGAGAIGGMIENEIKGQAPSEVTTNTNVNPQATLTNETSGGGIAEKITSFIQSLAPKTVSTPVSIQPITSGGAGSTEAPQVDFSGMIADANSAMQQVNQAITAGMTNVASAVRMGTVMMNVAFRSGMNQAIITAQNTANRVVSVFSNLASRLSSAGAMAGAGFRNGLGSQAGSIISTAQSIANSVSKTIQSALRIASPSKVTTYLGEMVGAGLIAGMDGMVAGVESSANRLSLATLPTTDLGNTRYSGSISGTSTSSKLDEVIDAINRGQVIMMDSGALVGETSKQMDVALGQRGSLGGRHKL